jgi:hypothetical protein
VSEPICSEAVDERRLVEYWLTELGDAQSDTLEEHLFECAACNAFLERLAALGDSIRDLHNAGHIAMVVPPEFVRKIKDAGMTVREYRLAPQGSVHCTIAPEDDFVAGHLETPLAGVSRLDVILEDVDMNASRRLADIPFNAAHGEVVLLPSTRELRPIEKHTLRVHVIAVDPGGERPLGVYTFNHRRYGA